MATVIRSETHPGVEKYEDVNRDLLRLLGKPGRGAHAAREARVWYEVGATLRTGRAPRRVTRPNLHQVKIWAGNVAGALGVTWQGLST